MIKDNFSKAILHFKIIKTSVNNAFIADLLQETFDKFKLYNGTNHIQIVSDAGSENKGDVLKWIAQIQAPPCVQKIIAKTDIFPFSNSMIESSFHLFKHDFLKGKTLANTKKCEEALHAFVEHNQNRYFGELCGLTPQQVLDGALPDKKMFATQILQAQKVRKQVNKMFARCTMPNCS